MVYEPREDSYLLREQVLEHARGHVIDVGTGTGIQALAASKKPGVQSVEAVDIDAQAVVRARENGADAHQSDRFANARRAEYDTIICNAPYLPDEPLAPDVALDGGPNGYEWTIEFLGQAREHLSRNGQILLLISTLTNEHVIKDWLRTHELAFAEVAREEHPYEQLLVYRITWALPRHPEAEYLASGKRSDVYRVKEDVIKKAPARRVAQEAHMLQRANELGLGPTYKAHTKEWVRMAYIDGERIEDYAQHAGEQELARVVSELRRQAQLLDEHGIAKQEMTNPYKHVLVTEQDVVLIDWERAKSTPKPRNTNQLEEYLKRLESRHGEPAG